jgi:hypothetical protein
VRKSFVLLAVAVVVLAGCKVDTVVTIKVDDDGSGTVSARVVLDAEAVARAESAETKLEDAVRLGDLEAAGWKSSGWQRRESGAASIVVSKEFDRAEDAAEVVEELSGPDGPLRDVDVERDVSTFRTQWSFSGLADLEDLETGIEGDPELILRLAAERVDVGALDQQLLAQTKDAFRLRVVADLPDSAGHRFTIPPGTAVRMEESSSQTATNRVLLFAGGLVVLLVAVLVFLFGEGRDLRRRRRFATARGPSGRGLALFDQDGPEEDGPEDDGQPDEPTPAPGSRSAARQPSNQARNSTSDPSTTSAPAARSSSAVNGPLGTATASAPAVLAAATSGGVSPT